MANDLFSYSKKGQRKISNFVGQELLYDFVTSHLDPERASAVEEYIKSSKEAQVDIQKINGALGYLERLAEIKVSDAVLDQVKVPSSYMQVLLRKLRVEDWSPGIKMGIEVAVVAFGVISLSLAIPWHLVMDLNWGGNKEIILTEVSRNRIKSPPEMDVAAKKEDETQVFPDDSVKTPQTQVAEAPPPKTDVAQAKPKVAEPPVAKTPPAKTDTVAAVPPPPEEKEDKTTSTAAAVAKGENNGEKKQGFLYRGSIKVTNVAAVTPKFLEKIGELGGRKAGEVELGWKKGTSSYFHMTIPEAKFQALVDFAKDYGTLSLQKEKHDRVMPDGIVRIIFTIDEKK